MRSIAQSTRVGAGSGGCADGGFVTSGVFDGVAVGNEVLRVGAAATLLAPQEVADESTRSRSARTITLEFSSSMKPRTSEMTAATTTLRAYPQSACAHIS